MFSAEHICCGSEKFMVTFFEKDGGLVICRCVSKYI